MGGVSVDPAVVEAGGDDEESLLEELSEEVDDVVVENDEELSALEPELGGVVRFEPGELELVELSVGGKVVNADEESELGEAVVEDKSEELEATVVELASDDEFCPGDDEEASDGDGVVVELSELEVEDELLLLPVSGVGVVVKDDELDAVPESDALVVVVTFSEFPESTVEFELLFP